MTKKETLHRGKGKTGREKEWVDGTGRRDGERKTEIKRPVLCCLVASTYSYDYDLLYRMSDSTVSMTAQCFLICQLREQHFSV